MNKELILKMVEPYLKNKVLTYNEFYNIFSFLSIREQYKVTDILDEHGISLESDEQEDELEPSVDDNFSILYDDNIFSPLEQYEDGSVNYIPINTNIAQSNAVLCRLIQEGNSMAAQDICIKNQRLVAKYASAYQKYLGNDLDYDDLEQAGMVGLLKAAKKFDYRKGTSFSTYAVFWIRQAIAREIDDKGFRIRIPVHVLEKILKITKIENELATMEYSYRERITEISKKLGLSLDKVHELIAIRNNFLSCTSLNVPVGEEEESELLDFITDEEKDTEDIVLENERARIIRELIKTLSDREQKVISLRFGLDDGKNRTLEEVGKLFDVTRERIRQIEAKAIKRLRHPSRSKNLKEFY